MKFIFTFCGRIGCGKTIVSKAFATRVGAGWSSFGDLVRKTVSNRGLPLSRETLQQVGQCLVEETPDVFCRQVLACASSSSGIIVLDGLRHVKILQQLRIIVAPLPVVCVFIDVPILVRLKRIKDRDGFSAEELMKIEKHSTELEVQEHLRKNADITATNTDSIDNCINQIITLSKSIVSWPTNVISY